MTDNKNGVFAFVKGCIYFAGCTLNVIHIAARHGAKCLPNVDALLVDIHHFFNKRDKR